MRISLSRLAAVAALLGGGYLAVAGFQYQPLAAQSGGPPSCPSPLGANWVPPVFHSNIRFKFPAGYSGPMEWTKTGDLPAEYNWGNGDMVKVGRFGASSPEMQSDVFQQPSPAHYYMWSNPQMDMACRYAGWFFGWQYRILNTYGATYTQYADTCDDPEMGGCGDPEGGGGPVPGEYGDSRGGMSGEDPPSWKCDIYYEYETLPNGEVIIRYWTVLTCYPSY